MTTNKRVTLVCPHCKHGFTSASKSGRGVCPYCHNAFKKRAAVVHGEAAQQINKTRYAALSAEGAPCVAADTIRGDQIPISVAEAIFKTKCADKGWKPHRPSWPDFLVETETGLIAVEVKSKDDAVSGTQAATFTMLESIGVRVFLWRNFEDSKGILARWEGGLGMVKIGLK